MEWWKCSEGNTTKHQGINTTMMRTMTIPTAQMVHFNDHLNTDPPKYHNTCILYTNAATLNYSLLRQNTGSKLLVVGV